MPIYHQLGQVPKKRHVVFKKPDDGGFYYEQLMGNKGFTGPSSLFYHLRRPTVVHCTKLLTRVSYEPEPEQMLRMRHFRLAKLNSGGSVTVDRHAVCFNRDVAILMTHPDQSDTFFYRNGQGDELLFIAEGAGVLHTICGDLPYRKGDYLLIPRGITYRMELAENTPHRVLIIESAGYVCTPSRYRNEHGQLLEHSPFCERDIRRPAELPVFDEEGEYKVVVKQRDALTEVTLGHHPFDVVGWDGYYYPWAFNVEDFEPITGRVHQPPPVHQTFQSDGFVVCSFVPRLYDYHPEAVPAPYNHANVMTDEVLFYAKDKFMSRRGIENASLTLHPDGLPHGPHPGTMEKSIGQQSTDELAVMIDAFRPLTVCKSVLAVEDEEYGRSWLDQ
jgi:homogentisate 1,2-dioxygenase